MVPASAAEATDSRSKSCESCVSGMEEGQPTPMPSSHGNDSVSVQEMAHALGTTDTDPSTDIMAAPVKPAQEPIIVRNVAGTKAPKETLKAVYNVGIYKAGLTLDVLAVQSFMAGIYIAMAGHVYLALGGGLAGAALFPTGLIAVVLTSAELFTGDALVFVASVLGKRVSWKSLVRNWVVSWCFNFVGALFWAVLLAKFSDALSDSGQAEFAAHVAVKKAMQPWGQIFLKGIGANFMVCVGVWQATCAEEVAGKAIALWFPVTAFVAMGFDHCIANQFLIPVGMMLGASDQISVYHLFFNALLPATLGNIVGGGIMVGGVYWYVFDSMETFWHVEERIRLSRRAAQQNQHHDHHHYLPSKLTHRGRSLFNRSRQSTLQGSCTLPH